MNWDQLQGVVRNLVALGTGIAIGHGWITGEQATLIGGIVTAVAPLIWTYFAHTNMAKLAAASSVPEVKAIVVVPNGNKKVDDATKDPNLGKVIKEGEQPR